MAAVVAVLGCGGAMPPVAAQGAVRPGVDVLLLDKHRNSQSGGHPQDGAGYVSPATHRHRGAKAPQDNETLHQAHHHLEGEEQVFEAQAAGKPGNPDGFHGQAVARHNLVFHAPFATDVEQLYRLKGLQTVNDRKGGVNVPAGSATGYQNAGGHISVFCFLRPLWPRPARCGELWRCDDAAREQQPPIADWRFSAASRRKRRRPPGRFRHS